jgi:hypothetical protein
MCRRTYKILRYASAAGVEHELRAGLVVGEGVVYAAGPQQGAKASLSIPLLTGHLE